MLTNDALARFGKGFITGQQAVGILKITDFNPEQRLAYIMQLLVDNQKGTLQLLEMSSEAAKEVIVWKDTPEGQAWRAQQEAKRVAALTESLRKDVVQQISAEN